LLMPADASPHHFSLKPSHARALADAEVVFLVSDDLERFLVQPLRTLAGEAEVVRLSEADGLTRLKVRAAHGGSKFTDPHMWLDTANARLWLDAIAQTLVRKDPVHQAAYLENAAAAKKLLVDLEKEIVQQLESIRDRKFILFHDGFQYFENRFSFPAAATLALNDAHPPGARRVAELRELMEAGNIDCVFTEPQFPTKIVNTLIIGTETRHGELDPIGLNLTPGPTLYPALLRGLTASLRSCLEQ
jgi:zinc transport system substrate-binding protein